jgi:hypothetical protein
VTIKKIISGGQTGADRAALDFAIENNIPHGGWIPKGRMTEEGPLSRRYDLKETITSNYEERTEKNILDSDATLIFYYGELSGGTLLTYHLAIEHHKPVKTIDLSFEQPSDELKKWLSVNEVGILNVAGPRASSQPEIYSDVKDFLNELFFMG